MKRPRDVVVAQSASVSGAFDLGGDAIAAIYVPALDGTTSSVRLLASTASGGTYLPIYDSGGTPAELVIASPGVAQWVFLEAEWTYGVQFLEFECLNGTSPDAQAAARTFVVVTRTITGG